MGSFFTAYMAVQHSQNYYELLPLVMYVAKYSTSVRYSCADILLLLSSLSIYRINVLHCTKQHKMDIATL